MVGFNDYLSEISRIQADMNLINREFLVGEADWTALTPNKGMTQAKVAEAAERLVGLGTAFSNDPKLRPKEKAWLAIVVDQIKTEQEFILARVAGTVRPSAPLSSRFTGIGAAEEAYEEFEKAYLNASPEDFETESAVHQFSELYGRIAGVYGDFERGRNREADLKNLQALVNAPTVSVPQGLTSLHGHAKRLVAVMLNH